MSKRRLISLLILFLASVCLVPVLMHRLIAEEREFGRETGMAYLRVRAEQGADRLRHGESLPADAFGAEPRVIVAEVDAAGVEVASGRRFPVDGRCFGEACANVAGVERRVRATWPGAMGRGRLRAQRLDRLERWVLGACSALILAVFLMLVFRLHKVQSEARRHAAFMADVSHRLKTPLTSISLCAELVGAGRLDVAQQADSIRTVVAESARLSAIMDGFLSYVRGLRRG